MLKPSKLNKSKLYIRFKGEQRVALIIKGQNPRLFSVCGMKRVYPVVYLKLKLDIFLKKSKCTAFLLMNSTLSDSCEVCLNSNGKNWDVMC